MKPLAWSQSARIAAPPVAVFAWLRDLREDDHSRPAFLRGAGLKEGAHARREVRWEGDEARVRDSWGARSFELRVRVDEARRELRLRSEHGYESVWRAEPADGGTLLVVEGRLAPRGLAALFVPLFARRFRDQLDRDFRGHVADARESLEAR